MEYHPVYRCRKCKLMFSYEDIVRINLPVISFKATTQECGPCYDNAQFGG